MTITMTMMDTELTMTTCGVNNCFSKSALLPHRPMPIPLKTTAYLSVVELMLIHLHLLFLGNSEHVIFLTVQYPPTPCITLSMAPTSLLCLSLAIRCATLYTRSWCLPTQCLEFVNFINAQTEQGKTYFLLI